MLTAGMLYPVWLRGEALKPRSEKFWLVTVPLISAAAGVFAGFLFAILAGTYPLIGLNVALAAFWGASASAVMGVTMRQSSLGSPGWLAASNLLPNLLGCIALVVCHLLGEDQFLVTALLAAQLVGSFVYWQIARSRAPSHVTPSPAPDAGGVLKGAGAWFLLQALAGYGAILAIQTQAATLAAAALSVVGLVMRIVSALSNLVTNAILPRLVHSQSLDARPVERYLDLVCGLGALLALCAGGLEIARKEPSAGVLLVVVVATAWFCASSVNMGMKRLAARQLDPRVSVVSAVLNILVALGLTWSTLDGSLTVLRVLAALVLLDFLPGLALALITRRFRLAVASTCTLLLLTAVVTVGGFA